MELLQNIPETLKLSYRESYWIAIGLVFGRSLSLEAGVQGVNDQEQGVQDTPTPVLRLTLALMLPMNA